jgi:hypothetical protein
MAPHQQHVRRALRRRAALHLGARVHRELERVCARLQGGRELHAARPRERPAPRPQHLSNSATGGLAPIAPPPHQISPLPKHHPPPGAPRERGVQRGGLRSTRHPTSPHPTPPLTPLPPPHPAQKYHPCRSFMKTLSTRRRRTSSTSTRAPASPPRPGPGPRATWPWTCCRRRRRARAATCRATSTSRGARRCRCSAATRRTRWAFWEGGPGIGLRPGTLGRDAGLPAP